MKPITNFDQLCSQTGLTRGEMAQLFGVSRQTVYNWMKNGPSHYRNLNALVQYGVQALQLAVEAKILPFDRSLDKRERSRRVAVMQEKLKSTATTQASNE